MLNNNDDQEIYRYFLNNKPKVSCLYHPDYFISHFCKYLECLMPLCPECILNHQREHVQFVQTYEQCLTEVYLDLSRCTLEGRIYKQQNVTFAKKQLLKLIDDYFSYIENQYFPIDQMDIQQKLPQKIENLSKKETSLQELIYYYSEKTNEYLNNDFTVKINYESLEQIKYSLEGLLDIIPIQFSHYKSEQNVVQIPVQVDHFIEVEKYIPIRTYVERVPQNNQMIEQLQQHRYPQRQAQALHFQHPIPQ